MNTLTATAREGGKDLAELRAQGSVPAVVYGAKVASTPIAVPEKDVIKILRDSGEATLITLSGLPEEHEVLIHDIAYDVVKGNPIHIDFYAVERGKEIEVTVPLEFMGESPAEKAGGQLVKTMHEVTVKTTPGKIPANLEIDLETLTQVGDQIHVRDIVLPEGVSLETDADEAVVIVQEQAEEVEEETAAVDMDAVEVEKKGKEEEGESKSEES